MFFHKKTRHAPQANDNPYWMSFSDMMSGMLIIFILLCITLLFKLSQMEEEVHTNIQELKKANRIRKDIFREIEEFLKKNNITVYVDDNDTVLRIPAESFGFKHDSSEIPDRNTAKTIGCALYAAIVKEQRWRELETVFIEGHTDSTRPEGDDTDNYNWNLSTKRAVALWQFWIYDMNREYCDDDPLKGGEGFGAKLQNIKNREGKHLFSVSGYGPTRQAVEEKGLVKPALTEAQAKNRRIDIRITTRQPSIAEIESTIKPISK